MNAVMDDDSSVNWFDEWKLYNGVDILSFLKKPEDDKKFFRG